MITRGSTRVALFAMTALMSVLVACDSTDVGQSGTTLAGDAITTSIEATTPSAGITFGEKMITVGSQRLRVQVADTQEERALGLMYRETLDSHDGMLFIFEDDTKARFTMSRTLIPLTIGFYEADGDSVTQVDMEPCDDAPNRCPVYKSTGAYRYALEVAKGRLPGGGLTP